MKLITVNKKAFYDYEVLEKFEAGIMLAGQEVKSVKFGNINLKGSYVTVRNGEAWLLNTHISPYKYAGPLPHYDSERSRKLLLKKRELKYLIGKKQVKGLTILPLRVYTTKAGKIKVEIGICRGKKKYEKREIIKKREAEREMRRKLLKNF